jgi:internalin A
LGTIVHFQNDARLSDNHVLNPHWLTDGIYTIITSPKVAEKFGELHEDDLDGILDRKRYPKDKDPFILALMKKFELCFEASENEYLIPQLLEVNEPDGTSEYQPEDCLNFEYQYDIYLEGLLPRFIVKSRAMSRNTGRWRTGVILERDGAQALVRGDTEERLVVVRVRGKTERRAELLALIRAYFEDIHRPFKELKVTPWIRPASHPTARLEFENLRTFEAEGEEFFPSVVDGKIVRFPVRDLLYGPNGVELPGQTKRNTDRNAREFRGDEMRVFLSYAHKDETFKDQLETHLKLMERQGTISSWNDRKLIPGTEWRPGILDELERAHIILFLVSADFLASDFCYDIELTRAIERHNSGVARVIPIKIRQCDLDGSPLAPLQGLPKDFKPVANWDDRDEAWTNVVQGIKQAIKDLRR